MMKESNVSSLDTAVGVSHGDNMQRSRRKTDSWEDALFSFAKACKPKIKGPQDSERFFFAKDSPTHQYKEDQRREEGVTAAAGSLHKHHLLVAQGATQSGTLAEVLLLTAEQ